MRAAQSPLRPSRTNHDQAEIHSYGRIDRRRARRERLRRAQERQSGDAGPWPAHRGADERGRCHVDPATAALPMVLPEPVANTAWAQPGGSASKSMGHLALGTALARAFTVQAGRGSSLTARLASSPVVANGHVYTIDTLGAVRAFDVQQRSAVVGQPDARRARQRSFALRRRDRLRQRPHLCDQWPWFCCRAGRAQRRHRLESAPGRSAARRSDHRQRRPLRDQPGQPDLRHQ